MQNFNEGMFIQISADVKDALAKLNSLDTTLNDVIKSAKLDVDVKSLENAQAVFERLKKAAQEATKASASFGDSLKNIGSQMSSAADGYINAIKGVFDKIKGFAAAGAAGIGAALKSAFDVGGGFESSMTAVKVISGATAEQFDLLTAKARELGATLPITAQDAADAMTIMAQRGTSVKDILESVTDVTNLAISQNMSLADAADILGSAMTNFGIATTEASRVTDIFNNASNQSALTMVKLREALKYVAPTASAAGMALEQAMAAMEVLANSGFDGSMIGTGLAGVISKIAAATDILGVKTQDAQGNMRALADIFAELSQRGVTLSEMTDVFGERAAKMALSLVKSADSLGAFERNLKSLGGTQGAVEKQMDTWQNTVASLGSALESVRLTAFDQLKEKAKGTVNGLTDMVRAFDSWLEKTGAAQKILKAFLDGLGLSLPSLESFKNALANFNLDALLQKIKNLGDTVRHVFDTLKTFASIAVTAFNTVYNVIGKHTGVIAEYAQKLLGISYAAKLVGGTLSGAGGLLTSIKNLTEMLKNGGRALVTVGDAFLNATHVVGSFTNALSGLIGGGVIAAAIAAFGALAAGIKKSVDATQELRDAVRREWEVKLKTDAVEKSVQWFEKIKDQLKTGFEKVDLSGIFDEDVLERVQKRIMELQKATFEKVTASARLFNSTLSQGEKILEVTEKSLKDFRPMLEKYFATGDTKIFDGLPEQFKIVLQLMKADTLEAKDDILNALRSMSKEAWNALDDLGEGVNIKINMSPLEEFTERAADGVGEILDDLEARLAKSFEMLGEGSDFKLVVDADVSDALGAVDKLAKALSEKIGIGSTAARVQIERMLQPLAARGDQVASLLVNAFKKPEREVENLTSKFRGFVSYLGASPSQFMPALKQMLSSVQAIDPATGRVSEAFKKAYAAVKEFSNMTLDKLKSEISDVADAVKKGLLDKKALEVPTKQAKAETWLKLKAEIDWSALKGEDLDQARAVMISKFQNALKDIDEGAVSAIQKRIEELQKGGFNTSLLSERLFKDLDYEMGRLARDTKLTTEVQQKVSVTGMDQIPKAIADFASSQSGIVQQTQASTSQISNAGQALVGAMSNLQRAIELNTAAKGESSSNGINLDTSRLETICGSIMNAITGVQDDVKGSTSLLAAIQNAIASIKGDTTNNYNYDLDINQEGFTIQNKSDANSLANMTASAIRNGLGIATA